MSLDWSEIIGKVSHCGTNKVLAVTKTPVAQLRFCYFFHSTTCVGMLLVTQVNTLLLIKCVRNENPCMIILWIYNYNKYKGNKW